jgi:hypothetical protein
MSSKVVALPAVSAYHLLTIIGKIAMIGTAHQERHEKFASAAGRYSQGTSFRPLGSATSRWQQRLNRVTQPGRSWHQAARSFRRMSNPSGPI